MEKEDFEALKTKYMEKLDKLKEEYKEANDPALREYTRHKIIDFINEIKELKVFDEKKINSVLFRIESINNYGRFYNYSLAENLKEQITIISDSIRSSPIHQKQLERKNLALMHFKDNIT